MKTLAIVCADRVSFSCAKCTIGLGLFNYLMVSSSEDLKGLKIDIFAIITDECIKRNVNFSKISSMLMDGGAKDLDILFKDVHLQDNTRPYLKNVLKCLVSKVPTSLYSKHRLTCKISAYSKIVNKMSSGVIISLEDYYISGLELPNLIKSKL